MSENPTVKSWQARIGEATDAIVQSFVESMSYDWRLYKVDVAGSIAHATMLATVKLITDADLDAIMNGLKEIEAEIDRDSHVVGDPSSRNWKISTPAPRASVGCASFSPDA